MDCQPTERLRLSRRKSSELQQPILMKHDDQQSTRSDHLQVYVGQLERELLRFKELYERERLRRKEAEKEIMFLRTQLNRANQKRNRFQPRQSQAERDIQMKQEFETFSAMIDSRLQKFDSQQDTKNEGQKINLIENFCVFGVSEETILQNTKENDVGRVVTSMKPVATVDQQAAKMAFPSGVIIKRVLGDKIFQKATEIITKSYSRQNSFVIGFQGQSEKEQTLTNPETQKLLNMLNPQRRLFCLCVGTYDFTYCGKIEQNEQINASMIVSQVDVFDPRMTASEIVQKSSVHTDQIAVSQRVYCISSYFPFFSFFQDVLLLLLNMLKVERLEIYSQRLQGMGQADSRYHAMRVKQLFQSKMRKMNLRAILPNMVYQVRMLNECVSLRTTTEGLEYSCLQDCLYQILSIFTVDTFIEVLTLCLLEDKVVFVCQNSHILTFAVYLFSNILVRPFSYAFASVYILPSQQFLSVPFPVIYGLLKKKKWVEQNRILEHFKNTYVFLTPIGAYVHYTEPRKELLKAKPEKLKTSLQQIFKDIEKSRKIMTQRTSNYHIELTQYIQHSNTHQKKLCVSILETVKKYMKEEIYNSIPSREKIGKLKQEALKLPIPKLKDEHTHVISHIIKTIRDQKQNKDQFFERILNTQMLSMYFSSLI